MMTKSPRGFALLIAIVLSSVILAVGTALLDIAIKQILLASSAKNSQYAFYNADSALECALYWDQKANAFGYISNATAGSLKCNNIVLSQPEAVFNGSDQDASRRKTTFSIPCASGGISAKVTIFKYALGATEIYSNGYSSCTATKSRVERGLKSIY